MKLNLQRLFYLPVIFLFAFSTQQDHPADQPVPIAEVPNDSTAKTWIDDFKIFRDAVFLNDAAKVKTFFRFPLKESDIWYLVLTEKETEARMKSGKEKPFTEKDFSKYYKKIFSKYFIKTLLKIKSAELFKKGETESPEIKEGNTTFKMYATVDKEQNTLSLNLSSDTVDKDENGQELDGGEANVIYIFRIIKNEQLQFLKIMLAG